MKVDTKPLVDGLERLTNYLEVRGFCPTGQGGGINNSCGGGGGGGGLQEASFTDRWGRERTVKVGDKVGFKKDVEQTGRVVEIRPRSAKTYEFLLESTSSEGFDGDYIGGAKRTLVNAEDTW